MILGRLRCAAPLRVCIGALIVFFTTPLLAQAAAINYVVSLTSPKHHLVTVQVMVPTGARERELQLPVWNALYQVRDFAQYVNWVRAKDVGGRVLVVRQLNQSRWQIGGAENGAIVEYEIFADDPGPFGAQLNEHHAFFNLAEILMYPPDARNSPCTLRFNINTSWHVATPLRGGVDTWLASSYDDLVDSPVEIGNFQELKFDEGGGHYRVIVDADHADYEPQSIVRDLRKIVAAATTWMNDRPFENYMFIYHFPRGPAGGGMEHAYSTAIDVSAEALQSSKGSGAGASGTSPTWRSVSAHEFFHLWNVKRIRPQSLEPVDYTKENITRALWFSEGVTSTAEGIIELRAGLLDENGYLARLGGEISELERRPAHLTQSAEECSLDAWLEGHVYYRRPERSISYYNKGELLGVILDLAVRQASRGQASLREVFHWMNQHYAKERRFFNDSDGVREAAEAVSHADVGWFFAKYVAGTEEIPWNDFFGTVGLRVVESTVSVADAGFDASRNFDGPLVVESVTSGSNAEHAGLAVGDTILEVQGRTPASETVRVNAGETIRLKVRAPGGTERELNWTVGSREEKSYQVKELETVTPEQTARRAAWLKGEAERPGDTNP